MTSPNPTPRFSVLGLDDLRRQANAQTSWLWQAYLAPGNVTLLTSQWKAGKTTLLSLLLQRMKSGGELLGLPVRPGKAVILSEESPALWCQRARKLDLADHVFWLCRPFLGKPGPDDWRALLDHLLSLHAQVGLSLLAIDSLAAFLPTRSENDATAMLDALLPLQRLTDAGLAVFPLHHPRKELSPDGRSARGSGALSGWVDVLLEMHFQGEPAEENRRRRLLAWSRHDDTPRRRLIELNADGTDYVVCHEEDDLVQQMREPLWEVLERSNIKLTRKQILHHWPPGQEPPSPATLLRTLKRCVERGDVRQDGTGLRNAPFRYWLPSLEETWKTDDVARWLQESADRAHHLVDEPSPYHPESDHPDEDD